MQLNFYKNLNLDRSVDMIHFFVVNRQDNILIFIYIKICNIINYIILSKINFQVHKYQGVTLSFDCKNMNHNLLNLSLQDASNDGIFMSLASINENLFAFFDFEIFDNNSLSINAKDMKILSLDMSYYNEFNELLFIDYERMECLKCFL